MRTLLSTATLFALGAFLLVGCSSNVDSSKPIDQIKSEVQNMNANQLEKQAQSYAKAIMAKKSDVEKIAADVKKLSPKDLLGDKAKSLKSQLSDVQSEVGALTKRYNIYADKFKELGGDVAKVKLG